MKTDRSTSKWLGPMIATQILILLTMLTGGLTSTKAMGDIPDAGAQNAQIINQLQNTNDKLDKLLALLSHGDLQVKVVKTDDAKGQ